MAKAPREGSTSSGGQGEAVTVTGTGHWPEATARFSSGGPSCSHGTTCPVHRAPTRPPGGRVHGPRTASLSKHSGLSRPPGIPRTGCRPGHFCSYFPSAEICLTPTKVPLFSKARL